MSLLALWIYYIPSIKYFKNKYLLHTMYAVITFIHVCMYLCVCILFGFSFLLVFSLALYSVAQWKCLPSWSEGCLLRWGFLASTMRPLELHTNLRNILSVCLFICSGAWGPSHFSWALNQPRDLRNSLFFPQPVVFHLWNRGWVRQSLRFFHFRKSLSLLHHSWGIWENLESWLLQRTGI